MVSGEAMNGLHIAHIPLPPHIPSPTHTLPYTHSPSSPTHTLPYTHPPLPYMHMLRPHTTDRYEELKGEVSKLEQQRDQTLADFESLEKSFTDLHQRYLKLKSIAQALQKVGSLQ